MLNFDKENVLSFLNGLVVYRRILKDEVISAFVAGNIHEFTALLIEKAHIMELRSDILGKYLYHLFLRDENVFTLACEKKQNVRDTILYKYAVKDIEALKILYNEADLEELIKHYENHGAGDMAQFSMFSLNGAGELVGVRYPDPITFDDIIGCQSQKAALMGNTEAFIAGKPVNNVLLVGSRGNGKSSCVKALINRYGDLRLVEVGKDQISFLPRLAEYLSERGKHFIIYMDDLSFEQTETEYKYLKSLLEGGAGTKPDNVLFCATSNRRHIIKESWKDRDSDDEIHIGDAINEKMSLSDRFGLTLYFPHINQEEYLQIVAGLGAKYGLDIDKAKALQWAAEHKRMSGRTAVQFLNFIRRDL